MGTDGTLDATIGNNATTDGTADDFGGTGHITDIDPAVAFTDAPNGDYTLKAGSPLIDAGADLTSDGVTTDIIGTERPQGEGFDIGAFELGQVAAPEIAVLDPDSNPIADDEDTPISFGSAAVGGSTVQKVFTIQNNGDATLTISSVTVPTGFEIDAGSQVPGAGTTIDASSSKTLTVNLLTAEAGTKSGDIEIESDDPTYSTFNFAVTGEVTAPAPTISAIDPATGTNDETALAFTITGTNLDGGNLAITIGGVSAASVNVTNSTTATGTINLTSLDAGDYDVVVTTDGGTDTLTDGFEVTEAAQPAATRRPDAIGDILTMPI